MRTLAVGLGIILAGYGCAQSTLLERQPQPLPSTLAPDTECISFELEASLTECHLPALSAGSTPQADDAHRVAQELWDARDWAACASAFDRVLELRPSAEVATEASYAAVICSRNSLEELDERRQPTARARRGREPGWDPPSELPPEVAAFAAYLARGACMTRDPFDRASMGLRRARIYYDHGRAAEAAVLFRHVALGPNAEISDHAAALWIDSLEELSRRSGPTRQACDAALGDAAERTWARWCSSPPPSTDTSVCSEVARLRGAPAPR